MPIVFKSKLSSIVVNATFVDKTIADDKKGRLGLYKTSLLDPDKINDTQQYINDIASTVGMAGESDPDKTNYNNQNFISNGDTYKECIEKLDVQVKSNSDDITSHTATLSDHDERITNNTRIVSSLLLVNTDQITLDENVYKQFIKVAGNAVTADLDSLPFGNTVFPQDCSDIILIGQDDTNTVKIVNNDVDYGCLLNGDATLFRGNILTLMYDATLLRYIEISRNF